MNAKDRFLLGQETAKAEGLRLKAYQDSKGTWTIGFGTNLQELEIDRELAEKLLADKLAQSERECERFKWYAGLSGRRQRAFVEMVYNLGLSRFLGFKKMIAAVEAGDFDTAANEALDSNWKDDVGPIRSLRIAGMIREG